ncbi:MAG: signal peptidase I, partial [Patescibacteria group bacterium]|nr:signal peptidase I [Patescibacteria group bacterium]
EDFDSEFRKVLVEAFFNSDEAAYFHHLQREVQQADLAEQNYITIRPGVTARVQPLKLGRTVQAGEPVLSFDLLVGDMLFVDRFSYHFSKPKVGDGFVFHTRKIPAAGDDQYYIKRLVGLPGDTLEIRQPVLYRNGQPIKGAAAFEENARQADHYPGYRNEGLLDFGLTVTVPPESYFALGDNSPISKDGRYWGFVPAKEVVGKPLFIYYPLTKRWGLPK